MGLSSGLIEAIRIFFGGSNPRLTCVNLQSIANLSEQLTGYVKD
jgi:hypothetical protein